MQWSSFKEELMSEVREGEEVYVKVLYDEDPLEEELPSLNISFSLIRQKMLKYETEFFNYSTENNDEIMSHYKPYIYEFNFRKITREIEEVIKNNFTQNSWVKMKIYEDSFEESYLNDGDQIIFSGETIFSASPIVRKSCRLVFSPSTNSDPDVVDINKNFDKTRLDNKLRSVAFDVKTENRIKNLMPKKVDNGMVTIFNIGQGNYVELKVGGKVFLFDIGMTDNAIDYTSNRIKWNYEKIIPYHRPDAIILSHWDIDHILGVGFLDARHIYSTSLWLAPDLTQLRTVTQSAYRLSFYLAHKSGIFLVNNYNSCLYQSNDKRFNIYQGKGTSTKGGGNKANNIGLLIEITDVKFKTSFDTYTDRNDVTGNSMLLSGDCDYVKMPDSIQMKLKDYDFLMVPHHGADTTLPTFCSHVHRKTKYAIVSYGKNRHNHPGKKHIAELEKMFKVIETKGMSRYTVTFVK